MNKHIGKAMLQIGIEPMTKTDLHDQPGWMIPASGTYQSRRETSCFPVYSERIPCLSNWIRPEITPYRGNSIPDDFHSTRETIEISAYPMPVKGGTHMGSTQNHIDTIEETNSSEQRNYWNCQESPGTYSGSR